MNEELIYLIASFFGGFPILVYVYRRSSILHSPYIKVDFNKRLFAAVIDGMICFLLLCPIFCNENFLIFSIMVTSVYILMKDGFLKGRSIGKFIVGLVVIRLKDGKPARFYDSIYRNFIFLIPGFNIASIIFEIITIYKERQGIRLGDKIAQTQVVIGKTSLESVKDLFLAKLQDKEFFKGKISIMRYFVTFSKLSRI